MILTGGDPLVLSPRRLAEIMQRLAAIDHVKIVRFHTRVPVVEPERIDAALIAALKASGKTTYVALHANHPRELTPEARGLRRGWWMPASSMVSQSVLLKGVNDDPDVLAALMRAFVETRIKPYYLHHPDLAPGTEPFPPVHRGGPGAGAQACAGGSRGLCQPTYILDIPGGHGKAVIGPDAIRGTAAECYTVSDFRGDEHPYPPAGEGSNERHGD